MSTQLLRGIRVLDLSRVVAGPFACQLLADLGAEVIKIERPGEGDISRGWGPPFWGEPAHKITATFSSANRNKLSVTIDLGTAEGREIALALAQSADVLVENYMVGALERMGLGYADVARVNPSILYCSITGFGQSGPLADRPGYDPIFQALSGMMAVTGTAEEEDGSQPIKVGVSIADIVGGLYADVAILAALFHREARADRKGRHIDISLLDCNFAAMSHVGMGSLLTGKPPPRVGNGSNSGVLSDVFACADGDVFIVAPSDSHFRRLCKMLGRPELADDPRFVTVQDRVRSRHELLAVLRELLRTRKVAEVDASLHELGIPASPILDFHQAAHSAHAQARGLVTKAVASDGTVTPTLANPIRIDGEAVSDYRAPPRLGEHNEAIFGALGLSREKLKELSVKGVI